jgi:hypothetical protein
VYSSYGTYCFASCTHRLHIQANFHPLASSFRRRKRHCVALSPARCATSTYATLSSSPFLRFRHAIRWSSDVPDEKDGRALGAQEWERCVETVYSAVPIWRAVPYGVRVSSVSSGGRVEAG